MWGFLKLLVFFGAVSTCLCEKRLLIDQLRWEFLELENSLWNLSENDWMTNDDGEQYLAKKFHDFDVHLEQMPSDLLYGMEPLRTLLDFLFLYSDLKVIDVKYQKFRKYLRSQLVPSNESVSIDDVIFDILNKETGVEKIMTSVHQIAYDQTDSMKQEIYRMVNNNYWCKDLPQSPQQLFYNLYNLIALNELKAYVMQQFAYLGSLFWDKEDKDRLSSVARKKYEQKISSIINGLGMSMKLSNQLWRCDPKTFIKGENYDEFTRLLQGHIQNEVDMSSRRTCKETCYDYDNVDNYGCYDYESDVCTRTERCNGKMYGCFFVEAHATICVSNSPSRRYDYVQYPGRTLGKKTSCPNSRSVNSWTRWFVRCHYCMCLCDQQSRSDRFINLRPVKSDAADNMVVTGLRLVKHNRILHIQIQEGRLLPYGYIDQDSVRWKKVDDYKITDTGVMNNVDMFTMTYGERSMTLDEIQISEDLHVLTGVQFRYVDGKIQLQICANPFDWHNGTVFSDTNYEMCIYESPLGSRFRTKQAIKMPDVPTKTPVPSKAYHGDATKYVEFTHTDFDKDAAQTTIPFIDTQEVANKPAVPLKGAGIYYKGNEGYGGFIAPLIKTYDFGQHMSSKMPPIGDRIVPHIENQVEIN